MENDGKNETGNAAEGQKPKPWTARVTQPDGKPRLIGVVAAANWLGCSAPCLGQMARGTNGYVSAALYERARREFPVLFGEAPNLSGVQTQGG